MRPESKTHGLLKAPEGRSSIGVVPVSDRAVDQHAIDRRRQVVTADVEGSQRPVDDGEIGVPQVVDPFRLPEVLEVVVAGEVDIGVPAVLPFKVPVLIPQLSLQV